AYADVIGSGRYSYETFLKQVDEALARNWRPMAREAPAWLPLPPCDALPAFRDVYRKNFQPPALKRAWQRLPAFVRALLERERLKRAWLVVPTPIRAWFQPLIDKLRSILK